MKTTWVTFYSYKGGVGRTTGLANVAGRLARRGRRVVMIDFDLEAPGLDSFTEFKIGRKPGVVEYVHQHIDGRHAAPINQFVHQCTAANGCAGRLWLMPSGLKDEHYAERLHQIKWTDLYEDGLAEPLIANWKKEIEDSFQPDYVFIDSRTGLTDVGGVCTLHFPDIDILFFSLNDQNIDGTAAVLRTISQASALRPIDVITIASPVPNLTREDTILGRRLDKAEKELGSVTAMIGYFGPMALEERVWTLDDSGSLPAIIQAYDNLCLQITKRARDGIDFHLARAEEMIKSGNVESASLIAQALQTEYGDRIEALRMAARLSRIRSDHHKATELAYLILARQPEDQESFSWVVSQLKGEPDKTSLRSFLHDISSRIVVSPNPAKGIVLSEIGHNYMRLQEYLAAAGCYLHAMECSPGVPTLPMRFNILEAQRRSTKLLNEDSLNSWRNVCGEATAMLDNVLLVWGDRNNPINAITAANSFQALSGAFAIIGQPERARELLQRADLVGRTLNPAMRVFSVIDYDYVSCERFFTQNAEILAALERGELWDGMKLPPPLASAAHPVS